MDIKGWFKCLREYRTPFLVLEFSKEEKEPYEDADPFSYDLPEIECEQKIRYALGIETD